VGRPEGLFSLAEGRHQCEAFGRVEGVEGGDTRVLDLARKLSRTANTATDERLGLVILDLGTAVTRLSGCGCGEFTVL
jgi:hypothetical protein